MADTAAILNLPTEIITQILTITAEEDIADLITISIACKALHAYTNNQLVWRTLFLREYDDPSAACAFLRPRSSYDFRTVYTERFAVRRFIERHELWFKSFDTQANVEVRYCRFPLDDGLGKGPAGRKYRALVLLSPWFRRITRVVLGLYLDLPKPGIPSFNEDLLRRLAVNSVVRKSANWITPCYTGNNPVDPNYLVPPPENPVDQHFLNLARMLVRSYSREGIARRHLLRKWLWPIGEPVNRDAVGAFFIDLPSTHVRRGTGVEGRGTGLLGKAERDWANVEGKWNVALGNSLPLDFDLGSINRDKPTFAVQLDLKLAKGGRNEIQAVSNCRADIWDHFPAVPADNDLALPSLYFYNTNKANDEDDTFIYGVVTLSSDSPPEVVWTIGTETRSGQPTSLSRILVRLVEFGGSNSKFGVHGYWGPRTHGRKVDLMSNYDISQELRYAMYGRTGVKQIKTLRQIQLERFPLAPADNEVRMEWEKEVQAGVGDSFVPLGAAHLFRELAE